MKDQIRILLVDDSPYFLAAACDFLQYQDAFAIVGVAGEEEEALEQSQALQPDVILLDLNLAHTSGLTLIPVFKEQLPTAKIVVLTMLDEDSYRAAALQAGADGFVHKSMMSKTLVAALLDVMQRSGAAPVHPSGDAVAPVERPPVNFLHLADHLPDLIYRYELAPTRGFTYVSPSATAMTGFTPDEHYADPDLGYKLVHPEDRSILAQVEQGHIEPREPVELRWVRKDGTILWTEQRNVNVYNEAGVVIAIEGIARDITARKEAEEAARHSNAQFRRIVETAQEGIWTIDAENSTSFANERMAEMLGYTVAEMMGAPLFAFMDDAERAAAQHNLDRRRQGIAEQHDFKFRRKDGSTLWALLETNPILDKSGHYAGALALVSDITARKRMEMALKSSEENYRNLVETSDSAIAVLDRSGRILYANPATVRIWEGELVAGKNFSELFSDDLANRYRTIAHLVIDDQGVYTNELETQIKGRMMWFRVRMSPLKNPDGSVDALVLNAWDLTEHKHTEAALRRREEELSRLIENSPDAITRFDRNGCYQLINSRRAEYFGLPRETILGRNWRDLLGPEDEAEAALADAVFQRILADRTEQTVEYETSTPAGKRWVQSRAVPELARDGSVDTILVVTHDITERKQAEEALFASERFIRETLDALTASIAILDETGVIVAVNRPWRAYAQAGGFDPALVSEGVNYLAVCDAADGENAEEAAYTAACIRAVMRGEEDSCAVEYPCHSPEEARWYVVRITRFDGAGPVRVVVAHENITERKLSEQAVAASEARYRELFESNPHPMWVYDLETLRFLAVNDTAIFRYGYSREEFLSMTLRDIRPIDEVPGLLRNVASERSVVQNSGGWRHRLRDGRLIDVEITSHSVQFQGRAARLVLANDVTERIQAEAALLASEARFRVTFEQAAVGIAHVAPSGKWLRVNQRLCDIVGYTREEMLTRSFQDITHPDDLDIDLAHVRQMLANKIQSYSLEKRYIRKDGRPIWINLTVALLRDAQGDPDYFISVVQDISERKQAQETLRQSEARYRALFEQSNDAVFILDLLGNYLMANRRASDMLGYRQEEFAALSYRDISALPELSAAVLRQILAGEHVPVYEGAFRRANGETFPVDINVELVRDHDGSPLHVQSIVRDTSERKRTEEALRLQGGALEAAANAIVITDATGTIQWVNPAWTRLTGYLPSEAVGKNPRMLRSGRHDKAFYKTLWDTILAGNSWHGELINRRHDGSLYYEEQTITPIAGPAGKITHFVGIKQDVTGRRQTEAQIRQQVARLAALREIDQTIASHLDLHTGLHLLLAKALDLLAVDAAAVLLVDSAQARLEYAAGIGLAAGDAWTAGQALAEGYAGRAAMQGRPIYIPNLAEAAENTASSRLWSEAGFVSYANVPLIIKGKVVGVLEFFSRSAQDRDDAWHNFLATLGGQAAIAVENARLYSTAQRELAERRRAEAELRILNRELEERVEARTADLKHLNLELERALHFKDEFLANMSHELRTPLSSILVISELLGQQIAGPVNEQQQKYLGIVNESGTHLLELINDILDIAKSEAGQLALRPASVDVRDTCMAAMRMVNQLAQKKAQSLSLEVGEDIDPLWADERRLKQALVNLLSNAVKFTPDGGQIGLTVGGDRTQNMIAFTVWDTGIGIASEDLPRLFQPFVQLNSHLARKTAGTGLGLALVAQIARLHGGSVTVASQPGQGSRFTITLPWKSPQSAADIPHASDAVALDGMQAGGTPATILLVEDADATVTAVTHYLEHAGYHVAVAHNGAEGIALAWQLRPDLILMDVQMPVLDGLEATAQLRQAEEFRETPIIALTALALVNDRDRCLASGMDDYLSKPVAMQTLLKVIAKQLAAHRGH